MKKSLNKLFLIFKKKKKSHFYECYFNSYNFKKVLICANNYF